jgi:hypothetical protein
MENRNEQSSRKQESGLRNWFVSYCLGCRPSPPANEQTSRAGGTLPRARRLGHRRAQLTYFWWVVLGGNKLRVVDLDVIPKDVSSELLEDWLALFREAALPIIGEEFTRAWMQRAERLARRFLITDGGDVAKLAKAS